MNYGEIERQTFRTFVAFSGILLTGIIVFFNIASNFYRVSNIVYTEEFNLNKSSIDRLKGTSIWLIDDSYFEKFYQDNPSAEKISIKKVLPSTLVIDISISEELAFLQDNRQSPPKTFILHKNLFINDVKSNPGLLFIHINNGPVKDGFYEEVVTFVLTLKKYSINLSNLNIGFDGDTMLVSHFNSEFDIGYPSDLARKASVIGYFITEDPCDGEITLVYNEDSSDINTVSNCQ